MKTRGFRVARMRHAWLLALVAGACGGDSDPTGPGNDSRFEITVRYVGDIPLAQRQIIETAVGRWRSGIVDELPDIPLTVPANACFDGQPALSEVIDDLLLYVQFAELDGPGNTIAQAGPCYVRSTGSLPVLGNLTIDQEDLGVLSQTGLFDDVVLHELGHVLGIGTLWGPLDLLSGAGSANPLFTGAFARAEYETLSGLTAAVPVENIGDVGTRDGHWRESVFGNELMTGTLNLAGNPLSVVTIASLRDLGYVTDNDAASPYALPAAGLHVDTQDGAGSLEMHRHEVLLRPRFYR
jgi:hypothetical protein